MSEAINDQLTEQVKQLTRALAAERSYSEIRDQVFENEVQEAEARGRKAGRAEIGGAYSMERIAYEIKLEVAKELEERCKQYGLPVDASRVRTRVTEAAPFGNGCHVIDVYIPEIEVKHMVSVSEWERLYK